MRLDVSFRGIPSPRVASAGGSLRKLRSHARSRGESRTPAVVAITVAIALYSLLPNRLFVGPRFLVPVLSAILVVPVVLTEPGRITTRRPWVRALSVAVTGLVAIANTIALGLLLNALTVQKPAQGRYLLIGALQVWLTNIIAFALAFWELDRGGPLARATLPPENLPPADFRFPQDEDALHMVAGESSAVSDWMPEFPDYLYVSITNSTAYSPTDTMPLSHWAKLLMGVQCIEALIVSVLVIARAVGLLS
jgi:hypothetical protein